MKRLLPSLFLCVMASCASSQSVGVRPTAVAQRSAAVSPQLGNFSVSLAVKDLGASRAFYEKLGFRMVAGDPAKHWIVLANDTARIGLFQGMFDKNTLTFNPGWDRTMATLVEFDDVRALQSEFERRGLALTLKADPASTGPAALMLVDPDGNPILVDQHVPRPR